MHQRVMRYVEDIRAKHPLYFKDKSVLEVGSQNINGTVRDLFVDCNYIGIDLTEGKDVDLVINVNDYKTDKKFDVVISCEALEHDKQRDKSVLKMYGLLKEGGILICTCANINRPEHGTINTTPADSPATTDYYRNISKEDIEGLLEADITESEDQQDLYFNIIKGR